MKIPEAVLSHIDELISYSGGG